MPVKTKRIIEVDTGEVKTNGSNTMMMVNALGSCIAVIVYDAKSVYGGIAHIMLPGKALCNESVSIKTRYSDDAIDELINQMERINPDNSSCEWCIAGGANVLKRDDDSICNANISAVITYLSKKNKTISAQSIGGFQRRRILFDIELGTIYCSLGDMHEQLLYSFQRDRKT